MSSAFCSNSSENCPQNLWVTSGVWASFGKLLTAFLAASALSVQAMEVIDAAEVTDSIRSPVTDTATANANSFRERLLLPGYSHVMTWSFTAKTSSADWVSKFREQCTAIGAGCAIQDQRATQSGGINLRALYPAPMLPVLQAQIESNAQVNSQKHDALQEGVVDNLIRKRGHALETLAVRDAALLVRDSDEARAARVVAKTDVDVLDSMITERSAAERLALVDISVEEASWASVAIARIGSSASTIMALTLGVVLTAAWFKFVDRRRGYFANAGAGASISSWGRHAGRTTEPWTLEPLTSVPSREHGSNAPQSGMASPHPTESISESTFDVESTIRNGNPNLTSNLSPQVGVRAFSVGINERMNHLSHHHIPSLIATIMAASQLIEMRQKDSPVSAAERNLLQVALIRTNRLTRIIDDNPA